MQSTEERHRTDPLLAASEYREKQVTRADAHDPFPLWHGWVIVNAFLAGIEWQKRNSEQQEP